MAETMLALVTDEDPTVTTFISDTEVVVTPVLVGGGVPGPQGPPGDPAQWTQITQAAYDALPTKDPNTLYVVIG